MKQLIYISTARGGIEARDVSQILVASRRNNGKCDVSGLLLFDGRRFLQALEGAESDVDATFERVKGDERHRSLVVLSTKAIEQRQFGDWAMAWPQGDQSAAGATLADAVDALTRRVPDANTREQFRSFARIDRKAA